MNEIINPTVRGMALEGCPFVGVLYAGLMLEPKSLRPRLLEYNVRFGDPETQVLSSANSGSIASTAMSILPHVKTISLMVHAPTWMTVRANV